MWLDGGSQLRDGWVEYKLKLGGMIEGMEENVLVRVRGGMIHEQRNGGLAIWHVYLF